MSDVIDEYNKRLPYWEYMRISEPSSNSTDLSVLVVDLSERVSKLEEEIKTLKDRLYNAGLAQW